MTQKLKFNKELSLKSFSIPSAIEEFGKAVDEVGLWESEKKIFKQYINLNDKILDLGCGAGRTTFGLYELGYSDILGADFSEAMIAKAKEILKHKMLPVNFEVQDACDLPYQNNTFNTIVFSFTGLTQIPFKINRLKAIEEIYRTLNKGGIFIFTTHDRDDPNYKDYWLKEKEKWNHETQDNRLEIYGDRIIERGDREIYIHFPVRSEIIEELEGVGFKHVDDILRSNFVSEPQTVMDFSTDSRFWVFRK